jgi:hypothetical protein
MATTIEIDLKSVRERLLTALVAAPSDSKTLVRRAFRKVYERRAALSMLIEMERLGEVKRGMNGVYRLTSLRPAKLPTGIECAASDIDRDLIDLTPTVRP